MHKWEDAIVKRKWEDTPFDSIEEARVCAQRMGLCPTAIVEEGGFRFFKLPDGHTIAQKAEGGVVKERQKDIECEIFKPYQPQSPTPELAREPGFESGPWLKPPEKTFEEVEAKFARVFINPDNLEKLQIVMYRPGDSREYEYALDGEGVMWLRVLWRK